MRFALKTIGAMALLLVLALVAVVVFFDWDAMRPEIEQRLSAELEREVRIAGPLDVRLGMRPRIVANDVSVANAPWARADALLEAERAEVRLRLWPLFRGRLEVVRAAIEGGSLALEQNEAGEQNWDFLPEREEDDAPPGFEELVVRNMAVSFDHHGRDGAIRGGIERLAIDREGDGGPLAVSGRGQLEQRPFAVDLDLGGDAGPQAKKEDRFPVQGTVQFGDQAFRVNGQTGPARRLEGGGLELQAKGENLHQDLAPFGIALGPLPPYEASVVLEVQKDRYRVHELRAVVGQSQLAAEGLIALEPPALRGAVHVARLHLPDLESAMPRAEPRDEDFAGRPLPVDLLRRAEAALELRIDQITDQDGAVARFAGGEVDIHLQDGVLRVSPLQADLGKARLEAHATLDASVKEPTVAAEIAFGRQSVRLQGRTGADGVPAKGRYTIRAEGRALSQDLAGLGVEIGELPPYKASAALAFEGGGLVLGKIDAALGESRLTGEAFVSPRPLELRAKLRVPRLHVADLPLRERDDAEPGNPLQASLPLDLLRETRAALDLRIDRITGDERLENLESLRLALQVRDGVARLTPLHAQLEGTPFTAYATIDATVEQPTIDARASHGGHSLHLKGRTGPQGRLAGGSYRLFAQGEKPQPPYEISAALVLDEQRINVQELDARLGESQIEGEASIALQPPRLRAELVVPRLHVPDLQALRQDETEEPGFLDRPLPVDLLRRAQAELDLRVERVTGELAGATIDGARLSAVLREGALKVSPLAADVSQGTLEAFATLDATAKPPTLRAELSVTGVRLEEIVEEMDQEDDIVEHFAGSLGGSAELAGAGATAREMLASLGGSFGMAMEGGTMSYVADRLAALDLRGIAKWLAGDDEPIAVECMISVFEIEAGVARPRIMLLASEDTDIWGEGEIDLREGTIDLELVAEPRDARIGVLRAPIRIEGDLASPSIAPEAGPLAARGAAALALGAIAAPVAALLGTLTTGPGEETVCQDYWSAIGKLREGTIPEKVTVPESK